MGADFENAKRLDITPQGESLVKYERPGETPKAAYSNFYRGDNSRLHPHLEDHSLPDFFERFVFDGLLPPKKLISRSSRVTAFGSCFAVNITNYLGAAGFDLSANRAPEIYVSQIGEGLVNVYALLSQFEWAFEGIAPQQALWHGPHATLFPPNEEIRKKTEEVFRSTDVFIVTLGLSEIWYDEYTNTNFWRAVPLNVFDPSRHKFRVCSHAETKAAIEKICILVSRYCSADIIFTLSPIPLHATFRAQSCLVSSAASKAILRSAIDEFFRDIKPERCYYYPAYEIVNELFPSRFFPDARHPREYIIDSIMQLFEAFYCDSSKTISDAARAFREAQRLSARDVGNWIAQTCEADSIGSNS